MFKEVLDGFEKATRLPENTVNARALLFNEWARLFQKAYEPGKKVIYTSVYAFPMEILAAFDVAPFDFELAGTMLSATPLGTPFMEAAEQAGYSTDLCSFHRTALGAFHKDSFPRPDLLITTSFFCDGKMKTNELLSRLYGRESQLLSVPPEINAESVAYVKKQLRAITGRIAETSGQRFDEDRLKEAVRHSNRARRMHLALLDLLKRPPFAWSSHFLPNFAILGRMFAGSEVHEKIYAAIIQEIEDRLKSGKAAPERHRVYWFAWSPTYRSNIFDVFKEHGVAVPVSETLLMYWDEIDEGDPFTGLALRCLTDPFIGSVDRRAGGLEAVFGEYRIDGALLFATPACRHANAAYRVLRDRAAGLGVPFLLLDMDISDSRGYSPEQVKTRLEGFIELMDTRKAG